jgi:hypothetical protein
MMLWQRFVGWLRRPAARLHIINGRVVWWVYLPGREAVLVKGAYSPEDAIASALRMIDAAGTSSNPV